MSVHLVGKRGEPRLTVQCQERRDKLPDQLFNEVNFLLIYFLEMIFCFGSVCLWRESAPSQLDSNVEFTGCILAKVHINSLIGGLLIAKSRRAC